METCSPEKLGCVFAIRVTEEDCPNKCQGLIVGVRKDPVTRLYKVQTSVLRVLKTVNPRSDLWPPVLDCNIRLPRTEV